MSGSPVNYAVQWPVIRQKLLGVLKRMRVDRRTRLIPVVVLTSSREERDIVVSYQLGVNSYIVRPVDFDQSSESVRQVGFYWLLLNQPPTM